jgi:putative endonuclease
MEARRGGGIRGLVRVRREVRRRDAVHWYHDRPRRLAQHNAGTASKYTRTRRPVAFAYTESQPDRSSASKREAAIKALRRDEKEALTRKRRRRVVKVPD